MFRLPDACYLPSVLDRKLADAFAEPDHAEAERLLARVPVGPERIRVQLACVRASRGSLARLETVVARALSTPVDVVAEAEDEGFVAWVVSGDAS